MGRVARSAIGGFAELLAGTVTGVDPARAWAGAWLAYAGWLAVGTTDPQSVAEWQALSATDPDPLAVQPRCWGLTRAEIISAIRGVTYVTIFDEKSPSRLLGVLKPDFQCKGTDYTPDSVAEAEVVRAYGGKVVIVGDPKDHSTTEILRKMRSV